VVNAHCAWRVRSDLKDNAAAGEAGVKRRIGRRLERVARGAEQADRVAVELMGIDFAQVGYLNYCGQAGMGETDLAKIQILGPKLTEHVRTYKLAKNLEQQLIWKQPVRKV
jgi:hypothetical protein